MVAFFIATDVIGLVNQSAQGLVTMATFWRAAVYLPALLAGVWVGVRSFKSVDAELFRKIVLIVLAVLAVLILLRAVLSLNG